MPQRISATQALLEGRFQPASITVENGKISAIDSYEPREQDIFVDENYLLFPGVVDTHVHLNEPGRTHWEGFESGTRAAAAGGATTVIDMPLNSIPPTTTEGALKLKKQVAEKQIYVDTGFWGGLVPGNLGELKDLVKAGVFGFKCFTLDSGVEEFPSVDEQTLYEGMREIKRLDSLLVIHAEHAETIEAHALESATSYTAFADSRPPLAEVQAIEMVLRNVEKTGCRTHILHVSSAEALEVITQGKKAGLPITAETCPHYLTFVAEEIPDGASQFKCCPPIRSKSQQDALWRGLLDGTLDLIVSDHSPADAEQKFNADGDLVRAWGGVAGLQVSFTAVAAEATKRGIPLEKVAQWMSASPANLVGLSQKGRLEVGADADFLIYNPLAEQTINAHDLQHKNPISAYDGARLQGRVEATIVRGETVYALGQFAPRRGTFLTTTTDFSPAEAK
ncbi:allantoinase AllB [Rothia aerolata]|uniref:allantoinase n=1 Tax=Rothia aerolata TaxID=1812262 RepID=A0A917IYX1_9MICC|nr:allantoinase AllB [Rothia aerolata]GGH65823.1 allantoinase [Rothia aerolata]